MIEELFYHKGLKCVVVFTNMGHRCGYVGVPPDHPLYGKDYGDVYPPVHGGLTYSAKGGQATYVHGGTTYTEKEALSLTYPTNQIDPIWWFGFDCRHYEDAIDLDAADKYLSRTNFEYVKQTLLFSTGTIRTKEFVIEECKVLAEYLQKPY